MTRTTILAVCSVALAATLVGPPVAARIVVGDVTPVAIDAARDYQGSHDGRPRLVWEHEIQRPGATYLALHFRDFRLAPGDWLDVSDGDGGQAYRLEGRGKLDAGEFWARHVKGDTLRLELWATSPDGAQGFTIDELAEGFGDLGAPPPPATESICGFDDKQNAICFQGTPEYEHARPVARLLIAGASLCTGWLASGSNHLVTNEHCISSEFAALNTDYEFMSEAASCGGTNCQLCHPGDVYSGGTLIQDNPALDYALVQITSGNPAGTYGWLSIDDRDAIVGEEIYIPQHPGGRAKEIAADDNGSACTVDSVTSPSCTGAGYFDVGYLCDTEGGSSGSPVIAASTDQVIALHHCAACPNRGVPIDLVHAEIGGLLGPQCAVDADCDDGEFCNGAETCSNGACSGGGDPCPGENCDETMDVCVPIVCDFDGVCEGEEDCNDCGDDCISGTASVAVCGDGVCEPTSGENCLDCPADCNGRLNGKPSSRFCCGDDVGCLDARCSSGSFTCNPVSTPGEPYCCGDGECTGDENSANCALDCGASGSCGDGVCDGAIGEDPATCPADCATCADVGAACVVDSDCCGNKCRGPSGRMTCK